MIELDRIYNEDCLEGMKRIPDGMVDAIITDLPYGVLNGQSEGGQWDSIIPLEPMWEQFLRVTKPSAPIVLFGQGMFTAKLMMSQPKLWRYNLVWDKIRPTSFLNCNRMPMRQHEDIAVFYRKLPTYNPQMVKGQRNHSRGFHNDTNSCYGKYAMGGEFERKKQAGRKPSKFDDKYPISILTFEKVKATDVEHPTQKPVDLLRYLVLTYSNSGGVILDATIGSGTTAVACIREHRHFIGFETNREYYERAQRRIEKEQQQLTLF